MWSEWRDENLQYSLFSFKQRISQLDYLEQCILSPAVIQTMVFPVTRHVMESSLSISNVVAHSGHIWNCHIPVGNLACITAVIQTTWCMAPSQLRTVYCHRLIVSYDSNFGDENPQKVTNVVTVVVASINFSLFWSTITAVSCSRTWQSKTSRRQNRPSTHSVAFGKRVRGLHGPSIWSPVTLSTNDRMESWYPWPLISSEYLG